MTIRLMLASLIFFTNTAVAESETNPIIGFFDVSLGKKLSIQPVGIFKGSRSEPGIDYIVKVPSTFEIKYFKKIVASIDTETGIVGSVSAKLIVRDIKDCLMKKNKINVVMSSLYKDANEKGDGNYRHGDRFATVYCGHSKAFDDNILNVIVYNVVFNRKQNDKYILRELQINSE